MHIIRFRIMPWERERLSLEVGRWLMPTQQALDRIEATAQRRARRAVHG